MPSAEIIAIGTELLLGEIQDSNTRYLAKKLRQINVDLFRSTMIGDNASRISELIKEALSRTDIVITSGGLGPTVDDPTRLAVAQAVNSELTFLPELWEQISDRFKRYGRNPTENNRRQAYIPKNAIPIENPVGTAPVFFVEIENKCIISLPGVPHELEYLWENKVVSYLTQKYHLSGIIKICVLHSAGLGESMVDEQVADLELLTNPTVGLLAHPGQTDIRITAKAQSDEEAEQMISDLRQTILTRLGDHIYGSDEDTLESVILSLLDGHNLMIYEMGLSAYLSERLKNSSLSAIPLISLPDCKPEEFPQKVKTIPLTNDQVLLGIYYDTSKEWPGVQVIIRNAGVTHKFKRSYGGPVENAQLWAVNTALDYLRRILQNKKQTLN